MPAPRSILTDIEGTTTPIAFVRDTLFPYARTRLADFIAANAARPDVAAALAEVDRLAPGEVPLAALHRWMTADAKVTPLKTLQGLVWAGGYRDGSLRGALHADVAAALRRWHAAGIRLAVYSSGSADAQRLLFGHSVDGDLATLFDGFYDTTIGAKREPASYRRITGGDPAGWLFLSDIPAELDAAAAAGLAVCQIVREADGTIAADHLPQAATFEWVERRWHG